VKALGGYLPHLALVVAVLASLTTLAALGRLPGGDVYNACLLVLGAGAAVAGAQSNGAPPGP
jgi:hypothetical protein